MGRGAARPHASRDDHARAEIDGIEDGEFQTIAENVKKGCPISRALAATTIELKATLVKSGAAG